MRLAPQASSGHLGTPFGCAPLANALHLDRIGCSLEMSRLRWGRIMRFSPFQRQAAAGRCCVAVQVAEPGSFCHSPDLQPCNNVIC